MRFVDSISARIRKAGRGVGSPKSGAERVGVKGYLEAVTGLRVRGWAFDERQPRDHVKLDILVDGELVGRVEANQYRGDLQAAEIGDGSHGFTIDLPAGYADGVAHEVHVRLSETERQLNHSPMSFTYSETIKGEVEGMGGGMIYGWVVNEEDPAVPLEVSLWDEHDELARAVADEPRGDGGMRFLLPIPESHLDGRPHCFFVKGGASHAVIGAHATVTSFIATPWDWIRKYNKSLQETALSPQAGSWYRALHGQLRWLLEQDDGKAPAKGKLDAMKQVLMLHDRLAFESGRREPAPIIFPKVKSPKASLVIPVFNKFELTYQCLTSLLFVPNKSSFEVILVDDGSTDRTAEIEAVLSGARIIRHEANKGFVASCNDGALAARGEYVVILNNDTEFTPNWLDELLNVFDNHEDVGMAGPKFLYPDGRLQEAGGIVWRSGEPWNYGRGANANDPRYNYVREVDYLSGACLAMPKTLWGDLGGFDRAFAPGYYEDTDLAFRVREAGFRVLYTPLSEIFHLEGGTSGTSLASGMKQYQEINQPKFISRWSQAFRNHGRSGENPDLEKDRGIDYRVLFIDHQFPQPDMDAGSYAAIQEIKLFQSLGFKVTFIPRNLAYAGDYTKNLMRMGVEPLFAPFYTSVEQAIDARASEFDVIYITRYSVAQDYIDRLRERAPHAKIILNNADLHFLRELRAAIASEDRSKIGDAVRTREAELAVMRKVDLVLSYNEVEFAVIQSHNLDSTKVAKCPWVVEVKDDIPGFEERQDIAFLGGYRHHPNVEAVEFFATKVMPLLRERLPGVRFLVYGSCVPDSFKELEADDIVIKGFVNDVSEVYDNCRVFVSPLLSGAGIKGKVIDCMAHGVPSVLSPVAAEGTGVRDGLEAMVADSPEEWVERIAQCYTDTSKWTKVSTSACDYVARTYSMSAGTRMLSSALKEIGIHPELAKE